MPKVKGKHYPYTKAGYAAAAKARKKKSIGGAMKGAVKAVKKIADKKLPIKKATTPRVKKNMGNIVAQLMKKKRAPGMGPSGIPIPTPTPRRTPITGARKLPGARNPAAALSGLGRGTAGGRPTPSREALRKMIKGRRPLRGR